MEQEACKLFSSSNFESEKANILKGKVIQLKGHKNYSVDSTEWNNKLANRDDVDDNVDDNMAIWISRFQKILASPYPTPRIPNSCY